MPKVQSREGEHVPGAPAAAGNGVTQYERTIHKTVALSAVVILANVLSNYALARGLRDVVLTSWSPLPYVQSFAHPWVAAGVALMFFWFASRLALLSWADLSYALPVTSFSYALSALVGRYYLEEKVSLLHWVGIAVISLGVALVALTYPETTPHGEPQS
jgi:drug/metabolite transporter (DMT)-like permease